MTAWKEVDWVPYRLHFLFEAITSRQSMRSKDTYFLRIMQDVEGEPLIGEVPLFRGLSAEDTPGFEDMLESWCRRPEEELPRMSSLRFGVESAMAAAEDLPDTPFFRGEEGLPINGLIWMGDRQTMRRRIDDKLAQGFSVLKLKIGGINFEDELELLRYIRSVYSPETLELRLDANGSFSPADALDRLGRLSHFGIHSIEQPVKAGMPGTMARICRDSPIPVALDEELIGCTSREDMRHMLAAISPAYIILKPALCGGFSGADAWIEEASCLGVGWWATSALESNVGLLAIARWLATGYKVEMPQGLGTGQLYSNNFQSPLQLRGDRLYYDPQKKPSMPGLLWHSR